MRRTLLLLALAAGGLVVAGRAGAIAAPGGAFGDFTDGALGAVDDLQYSLTGYRLMGDWMKATDKPENFRVVALLRDAERRHGIPVNLLVRLAWQESRFRKDAYNPSGASGVMQIVPRWHPGVDPYDAPAAIDYAAGFLVGLRSQFGTWELALKAYNWGPGNVQKWQRGEATEPLETQNYSAQILADLAASGQGVA